jgi:hypothetical protein
MVSWIPWFPPYIGSILRLEGAPDKAEDMLSIRITIQLQVTLTVRQAGVSRKQGDNPLPLPSVQSPFHQRE